MGEGCSGHVVERYCLGDRNARGDKWVELCGSWEQHARKSCLNSICKLGGSRVPPSHTVKNSRILHTSKNFLFSTLIKTI